MSYNTSYNVTDGNFIARLLFKDSYWPRFNSACVLSATLNHISSSPVYSPGCFGFRPSPIHLPKSSRAVPLLFDPCLLWPNGRPSQLLLNTCTNGRPKTTVQTSRNFLNMLSMAAVALFFPVDSAIYVMHFRFCGRRRVPLPCRRTVW